MKKVNFTLIELLVVVAIIGILASLLMPSLQSARGKAKTAVCLAQQRQMGTAYIMYVDDNDDVLIPRIFSQGQFWHGLLFEYHNDKKAIQCSTVQHPDRSGWYWGSKDTPWGGDGGWIAYKDGRKSAGSIGLNGWLYSNYSSNNAAYWSTLTGIDKTSNVPIFTDNIWVDTWPSSSQSNPTNIDGGNENGIHRVYMNRHWGKKINTVRIDNSAKTISVGNILYLDWSKTATYRAVPIL